MACSDMWPDIALPKGNDSCATLLEPWRLVGLDGLVLTIPKGFKTDGASIPRFLWILCGHPLQSPRVYAALVHDFLYSGGVPGMARAKADKVYRDLLVYYGWGGFRARIEYFALRLFGAGHWTNTTTTNKEKNK